VAAPQRRLALTVFQTGEDFLVAAIGPRRDIYERLPKIRLARWAGGIRILETETHDVASERDAKRDPTFRQARHPKPVENNGFSPFDDAMLRSVTGVDDDVLAFLRSLPPTVDAPTVIAQRLANTDLAFLLADFWEWPQHHLDTFARGAVPSVDQMAIEDEELRARLVAPTSETELVAIETAGQIRKVLDRSIEEWMIYLHPSQRAISNATSTARRACAEVLGRARPWSRFIAHGYSHVSAWRHPTRSS
jgi:hypothetical protein